jgi:S1-C subfamily serine protease
MKSKRFALLALLPLLLLTSCGDLFNANITVYLNYDNGTPEVVKEIPFGYRLSDLEVPERENSIFDGWYSDINLKERYTSAWVSSTQRLYAGYVLDVPKVLEVIENETLSSTVTVEVHNTKSLVGGLQKTISQGSGVIFYQDTQGYYVLTNNHVTVEPRDGSYTQEFYILDDDQNILYPATRIHELNTYDLAILCFQSLEEYHISQIEDDAVYANRDVIAIGTPMGEYNTITLGKTQGYANVYLPDDEYLSNVDFPVLVHNAEIDHGSSGGPLFDYKLDLIGINFASAEDDSDNPVSVSIPNDKILEYLAARGGKYADITPV